MSHTVNYQKMVELLGLSTHPHQLEKRKRIYPKHFFQKDNEWYITKQYAKYMTNVNKVNKERENLKKEVSNDA